MCAAGTGSSQTVCQMPVVGVYKMPLRLVHLLAARLVAGVGRVEDADDQSPAAPSGFRASVMSKVKAS